MTNKVITLENTTGSNIDFPEAGITLKAGTTRDLSFVPAVSFRTSNNIIAGVLSGDIVVNTGSSDLIPLEGEAYLSNDVTENLFIVGTEALVIPFGTTAQRAGTPTIGSVRINTDPPAAFEIYDGIQWIKLFAYRNFAGDTGVAAADNSNDTLTITGGNGITTTATTDTITIEQQISTIGGNLIPTFDDTVRSKTLSVESTTFTFGSDDAGQDKWIGLHDTADAATGYIMPYDGTVVWATAMTVDNKGTTTNWSLYINGAENAAVLTTTGSGEQSDQDPTLNIDFSAGDKIRWRARNDDAEDCAISVGVRWRV